MSNGRLSVKKRISAGYGMRGNLDISESVVTPIDLFSI
ncbi:hypothetical protein PDPUS_2_00946 [Photobacterium damselae subsp. piscicida]|uniref:Uncharacterized protein n=1 Tax=Photobacterium damsela subsp. piscicida TaxID=38294 RepID=A0A1V1VEH1_PHODP|nr:hypothetical protein PDPUS_2_00470 [Photobacterium damselae subsp. piscicida]BAX55532.1 hypothetical protein PDPUS_2_00946 [Photobacterium damselae subsp. piscicida]GAW46098.1 hypothetical protein PDPJ_2_00348 [Photobacterium damselae subsp. piscicida]GAW46553.1 hypothetical protein PDPJ_2_00803 [Photobacterium damselae subsp. piscicida]